MKVWTSEHTFDSPWKTVVKAAFCFKYPNPKNPNVIGLDVIDRKVGKDGVLRSHRIMQTAFGVPEIIKPFLGDRKICHVSEHSEVDPKRKVMTLKSRNVTFCNYITIDETLEYRQDASNPNKTHLKQDTVLGIQGIPMSSYFESMVKNTMSANAHKGREAIEWVIDNLTEETHKLSKSAEQQLGSLKQSFKSSTKNLKTSSL